MGLEKVRDKVLEESSLKAKSNIDVANIEAKKITDAALKKAKEMELAFKEKLSREIDLIKRRQASSVKLESKKQSLSFRKDMVDEIFLKATKKVASLPDPKRKNHIKTLLEKASKELEISRVICSKKDRKFIKKYKTEESAILGGIIAETSDGTLRVDYSYDTYLKKLKGSLLNELTKILFDEK